MRVPTIDSDRSNASARRHHTGSPLLVALGHPSLGGSVDRFLQGLPDHDLRTRLTAPALLGTVAIEHGTVAGIAHVAPSGAVTLAVAPDASGPATAALLLADALARGRDLGLHRFRLPAGHRSRRLRRLANQMGLVVVEVGPGRTDVLVMPGSVSHSA